MTPFYNALMHFSVNLKRKEPFLLEPHEFDWRDIDEIVVIKLSMLLMSATTFVFTVFSHQLSTFLQITMVSLNWRMHQWGLLEVTFVILHKLVGTFVAASTSMSGQATSMTLVSTCSLTWYMNFHATVNYIFGARILALLLCEAVILSSTSKNEGSCYFCKGLMDTRMKIDLAIATLVLFSLWHDLVKHDV